MAKGKDRSSYPRQSAYAATPPGTLALTVLLAIAGCASSPAPRSSPPQSQAASTRPVKHGRLSIVDGRLCGGDGKPVQLRGMSTAGLQWFSEEEGSAALKSLNAHLKEGRTHIAERESLLVPATIGPEGYPIWGPDELSASGAFVRARMRAQAGVWSR